MEGELHMNEPKMNVKTSKFPQTLEKRKIRSLGLIETLQMKFAGWVDGRKGLLRCKENGMWESTFLKQETDAYEEYSAELMGKLKFEEEDEFHKLNTLFDRVVPLRKKWQMQKQH